MESKNTTTTTSSRERYFEKKLTGTTFKTVLLKMTVTEEILKSLSVNLPIQQRKPESSLAFNHTVEAKLHGKNDDDLRKNQNDVNILDSGKQVVKTNKVRATEIFDQLLNAGYGCAIELIQKDKDARPIVQAAFTTESKNLADSAVIAELKQKITNLPFNWLNVWKNVDGTITVNFSQPLPLTVQNVNQLTYEGENFAKFTVKVAVK